jgi:two-component system chemotaxis response regulator CheB
MVYRLVVIGCSLGGLNAMRILLEGLSHEQSVPMVLVQHRDKSPSLMLSRILQRSTHLIVQDADDKACVTAGRLYIAPPAYHLLFEGNYISLSTEMPVMSALPSIDVALESAARSYGRSLVSVLLTSSSTDGAAGAAIVESRGGVVIVQNPETSENGTLPRAVIRSTKSPIVADLENLPALLNQLLANKVL